MVAGGGGEEPMGFAGCGCGCVDDDFDSPVYQSIFNTSLGNERQTSHQLTAKGPEAVGPPALTHGPRQRECRPEDSTTSPPLDAKSASSSASRYDIRPLVRLAALYHNRRNVWRAPGTAA